MYGVTALQPELPPGGENPDRQMETSTQVDR